MLKHCIAPSCILDKFVFIIKAPLPSDGVNTAIPAQG